MWHRFLNGDEQQYVRKDAALYISLALDWRKISNQLWSVGRAAPNLTLPIFVVLVATSLSATDLARPEILKLFV